MRKFLNYFLSFFALASLLFLASCTDEDDPGLGDLIINLDPSDSTSAAPGETITIDVDVTGGGADTEVRVVSDMGGTFNPSDGIITGGSGSIDFTVPENAALGDTYTLTFTITGTNISEQLQVNVQYANVGAVIAANQDLAVLNQFITSAGLNLADESATYTIFAPEDAAFTGFDQTAYTEEELANLLQYHVINNDILTSDELETGMYATMNGDSVYIENNGTGITVNGVNVVTPDLVSANGVVHIVDAIIMPDVTTYEAFLLAAPTGDQTSETFFSTMTGERYSYGDVVGTTENISQTIDFGYFYGQTNGATIAAPNSYPQEIYEGLAAWATRNNTTFRATSLTVEDFTAISVGQGDAIEAEYEAGTAFDPEGRATELAADDVVAFRTADNRYGLIRVVEVIGTIGSADGIQIEVKVTR